MGGDPLPNLIEDFSPPIPKILCLPPSEPGATSSIPNLGYTKIVYRHLNIQRLDVPNLTYA